MAEITMGLAPNAKIDPEKYKLPDGSLVLIGDGGYRRDPGGESR